jgi:hypothetical protein
VRRSFNADGKIGWVELTVRVGRQRFFVQFGEPSGQQRRAGILAMRTSGKGGARAARGTERGGRRKKGDGARWLLCAGTEGEKWGRRGPGMTRN